MDLIDQLAFQAQAWWSQFLIAVRHYGPADWAIAAPLMLVTEAPAYLAGALTLDLSGSVAVPPDERQRRFAYLETRPRISVLLVASEDEAAIDLPRVLRSWTELEQPGLEVLLIDNSPGNAVSEAFRRCPESDIVRHWRQHSGIRDLRRGSVFNLALQLGVGEIIITADARSSCDRDLLIHMVGPFHDDRIGSVTGTCKAVNAGASLCASLQAMEMQFSYGVRKRLLGRWGLHTQGTTVFGAYRRSCMERIGAFEPELNDGLDIALKIRRCGWRSHHAPQAIATLRVPPQFRQALQERLIFDREWSSALLRRHLHPSAWFGAGAHILFSQVLSGVIQPLLYAALLLILLLSAAPLLPPVLLLLWIGNAICYRIAWPLVIRHSERQDQEVALRSRLWLLPPWLLLLRLVRLSALAWASWRRGLRLLRRLLRRRGRPTDAQTPP